MRNFPRGSTLGPAKVEAGNLGWVGVGGSCKLNRLEVVMVLLFHGTGVLYIFRIYFP